MQLKLHHYWRSSSSWRVRWAFALKGIPCEWNHVHLLKQETQTPDHLSKNPMGLVPVLEIGGVSSKHSEFLPESVAIIEWAEEAFPNLPKLLPQDTLLRARARQLAQIINAGIQPLGNLGVTKKLSPDPKVQKEWSVYWIHRGLASYEFEIQKHKTTYSLSHEPGYADVFLIPQIYNAIRNEMDLSAYPRCAEIYERALKTETCKSAHPDRFEPK